MAGYIRQSTFVDGDTITASLFNNEYNQLVNSFSNTSGHKHDGTTAEGPVIGLIGDAGETSPNNKVLIDTTNNFIEFYVQVSSSSVQQLYIADGAIIPVTDSDIDLGTTSLRFKDTYTDTITTTGNVAVGGNLTVTGTTTFNGGTITMGDAATDNVVFGADVDSNIIPDDDDSYDLGSSSQEWRNLFIDGTANIDSLVADTADINGGTVDGAIIGGSSAAAITGTTITGTSFVIGSADISEAELETIDGVTAGTVAASKAIVVDSNKDFTGARNITLTGELDAGSLDVSGDVDVDGTTNLDVVDIDGAVDMATTLAVAGNVDFNGDLDVDGTTNLDVVDIDGAVDMATTLAVAGNVDFNGDLDVDGTTNLDVVDIDGAVDMATTLTVGGEVTAASLDISGNVDIDGTLETDALSINSTAVTSTAAELNILDGVTSTAAELNLLDGVTSTTAELNILDGVTASATDINLIDGITNGTVIASKAIITDANKDITGGRNITITGELDAATLDISGDADIDGTLEADAITIGGITLAETISDTVGAMVTSNTESGITVAYDDSDNTLDFTVGTLNQDTTGLAATATALATARTIGGTSFDGTANIAVGLADTATALATARTIHGVSFDGTANIDLTEVVQDTVGAMVSSNTESNITVTYEDSDGTLDFTVATLNQDTTGNAATATALETARTIHGISFDGTANIDLSEVIQDTVGAMVSSNTESGITVTYQDGDGTLDFSVASTDSTQIVDADSDTKIQVEESSDEDKIRFDTGGTERMIIDSTGVGIGTNSPVTDLDVRNNISMGDGTSVTQLSMTRNSANYIAATNASGYLVFRTGGANERMRIDSSGNVGIGTTSPSSALHVSDTSQPKITIEDSTNNSFGRITGGGSTGSLTFEADFGNAKAGTVMTFNVDNTERMRIDSSGNVGIGNISPSSYSSSSDNLVVGTSGDTGITVVSGTVSNGQLKFADGTSGDATGRGIIDYNHAADSMAFKTAATEAMRIDSNGNIAIGGTSASNFSGYVTLDLRDTTGGLIDFSEASAGVFARIQAVVNNSLNINNRQAYPVTFGTNDTERMRIDSSGSVGIGTTSPTEKLTVNGALAITGALADDRTSTAAIDFSSGVSRIVSYGASGTAGITTFRTASGGASSAELMRILGTGEVHITSGGDAITPTTKHSGATGDVAKLRVINRSGQGANKGGLVELGAVTNDGVDRSDVLGSVAGLKTNGTSGDMQGYLQFSTNTGSALSEVMRINSSGNVGIGTTDAGNAKLVINGNVGSGADTACIDFDGYGTYSQNASQSINFRMGRTGQATDQPASIKAKFMGGGATAAATHVGFEFNTINANTLFTTARFAGVAARIQFNTDEVPQSSNPVTQQAIVIGPSVSGAVTQGLTNATVLQNRSGELYAIDSSHNNTQITPHNWGLISAGPSEELAWTYYSQRPNPSNNDQLQTINVDMTKVVRKVEDLVGEKLVYTENSNMDDHTHQSIIADIQSTLANLTTRIEALEG